jgi:hypothetical protein
VPAVMDGFMTSVAQSRVMMMWGWCSLLYPPSALVCTTLFASRAVLHFVPGDGTATAVVCPGCPHQFTRDACRRLLLQSPYQQALSVVCKCCRLQYSLSFIGLLFRRLHSGQRFLVMSDVPGVPGLACRAVDTSQARHSRN